jgi:hypothetical protein
MGNETVFKDGPACGADRGNGKPDEVAKTNVRKILDTAQEIIDRVAVSDFKQKYKSGAYPCVSLRV